MHKWQGKFVKISHPLHFLTCALNQWTLSIQYPCLIPYSGVLFQLPTSENQLGVRLSELRRKMEGYSKILGETPTVNQGVKKFIFVISLTP